LPDGRITEQQLAVVREPGLAMLKRQGEVALRRDRAI
jgi:hypothetical protein